MSAALAAVAETAPVIHTGFHRTMDAAFLNSVANHPEVFPYLGFQGKAGELDLTPILSSPANVALQSAHGGYVLTNLGGGTYEAHSLYLPQGRGGEAHGVAEAGFRYMFAQTDCTKIVTKVPASNRAAAGHARQCGFKPLFERTGAWVDGADVSYQALTLEAWMMRDPAALERGHWFHDRLEREKANAGSEAEAHPGDEAHDRAVGAAVLMLMAGNPQKAVWHYNAWAALAGYAPITLLSLNPIVLDVVDAVIEASAQDMEVLLCR